MGSGARRLGGGDGYENAFGYFTGRCSSLAVLHTTSVRTRSSVVSLTDWKQCDQYTERHWAPGTAQTVLY